MSQTFRNTLMATTAKSAGALLIAGSIGASTAAADDKLTVTNNGAIPLTVNVLDKDKRELDKKRIEKNANATLSKTGVSITWVQAFRLNEKEPCYVKKDPGSSIAVKCAEKVAATGVQGGQPQTGSQPQGGQPQTGSQPQGAGQQQAKTAVTHITLDNFPLTPAELNAMGLKESDVLMDVEATDLVDQRKQTFSMPVGTKTIDFTVDSTGTMRMALKVSFRGKACFSSTTDKNVGTTSTGRVSVIRFKLTSTAPTCAIVQ
jgi:hypothetical protein